ncbi:hypothetical protein AeMF1_004083 [Aphanomyces euteiches]|nr:hypothetical protein AeMF1_004083 [Aphanomyces euteiches]
MTFCLQMLPDEPLDKKASLSQLWNLSPEHMAFIEKIWYGPIIPTKHMLLHHAFEEQVEVQPDVRALEYEDSCMTYAELNAKANAIAAQLVKLNVRTGSRVAVVMERCLEFPLGLLAVLKVGAATMPVDATFPVKRLAYMLEDVAVAAIVTTKAYQSAVDPFSSSIPVVYADSSDLYVNVLRYDATKHCLATPESEAYIVYTSGSTGKPKGVPVLHRGAVNTVMHFPMPDVFKTIHKVEVLSTTPTGLALIGSPSQYPNLKYVQLGGENVPTVLKDLWALHVCLTNCYGPSECAVMTNTIQLRADYPVTIGQPIANVTSYILDDKQRAVPIGVVGEFYLGGVCVSPHYINLPEQTSQRFIPDPINGGQMYRTGDLGRMLPNGDFQILGRQDTQVKLKGYRIELEKMAEAMMQHPQVVSAAAIVKDNTHLVAYYSPSDVALERLQNIVADMLPVYMVPAVWVGLNVMQMNTNGKIDQKLLDS